MTSVSRKPRRRGPHTSLRRDDAAWLFRQSLNTGAKRAPFAASLTLGATEDSQDRLADDPDIALQ